MQTRRNTIVMMVPVREVGLHVEEPNIREAERPAVQRTRFWARSKGVFGAQAQT